MTEEAVETHSSGKRKQARRLAPDEVIAYGPVLVWPPRPMALLKWLFGYPGYFLPWGRHLHGVPCGYLAVVPRPR